MNKQLYKITLKDCVLSQKGTKPILLRTKSFKEAVPYLDIGTLEGGQMNEYTMKELGYLSSELDVLVVWDGSRCGLTFIGRSGVVGSTLMALTPIELNTEYLYYFLKSKFDFINGNSTGSGIPHVDSKLFFDLEIPFLSIENQEKIIRNLKSKFEQNSTFIQQQKLLISEALNESIELDKEEDVDASINNFQKSILDKAFVGELTDDWRRKKKLSSKSSNKKKGKSLKELPSDWVWSSMGEIAKCQRGRFSARPRNDPKYYEGDYPFIQISDIPENGGFIESHKQTLNDEGIKVSKKFNKGTIVIAIVGSSIGNSGILGYDMYFPDSIIGITPQKGVFNKFVAYYLQKEKTEIRNLSYSSGGQPNLKLEYITNYPIPLPSLEEQKEIVKILDSTFKTVQKIKTQYLRATEELKKLEQSILQESFSYNETDFNDNPEEREKIISYLKSKKEEIELKRKENSRLRNQVKNSIKANLSIKKELIQIISENSEITVEELWRSSKHFENRNVEGFYEELIELSDLNKISVDFQDNTKVYSNIRLAKNAD